MRYPTYAVLSGSTGKLLGDIGELYKVATFLLGRDAYTHELAYYAEHIRVALRTALPGLPTEAEAANVTTENWRDFLAEWEARLGTQIDLPDSLRDCLADEKNCLETAKEMAPGRIIPVIEK